MSRRLHISTPLMDGRDVRDLQWRLKATGDYTGGIDSIFGPGMDAAVRSFQSHHSITQTGIMDPATWATVMALSTTPAAVTSAKGLYALGEAETHLGVSENPPGSNSQMFGIWFGQDGVPWCSIFVSYCLKESPANYTLCNGFSGLGVHTLGCSYVPTVEQWARSLNYWVPWASDIVPLKGDIAIYNWGKGDPEHIGIVKQALANGHFIAVEGNTSIEGSQTNGGEVLPRRRNINKLDGLVRIP